MPIVSPDDFLQDVDRPLTPERAADVAPCPMCRDIARGTRNDDGETLILGVWAPAEACRYHLSVCRIARKLNIQMPI